MICAPSSSRMSWGTALTDPAVPQGMKAGVSTPPCAVEIRPRRAGPDWASRMNGDAIGNMVQGIAEYEVEVLPRIYADQRGWEQRMPKAVGDWLNWSLPYPLTLEVGFSL